MVLVGFAGGQRFNDTLVRISAHGLHRERFASAVHSRFLCAHSSILDRVLIRVSTDRSNGSGCGQLDRPLPH